MSFQLTNSRGRKGEARKVLVDSDHSRTNSGSYVFDLLIALSQHINLEVQENQSPSRFAQNPLSYVDVGCFS